MDTFLLGMPKLCTIWTCRWRRLRRPPTGKLMLDVEVNLPEVYLHPGESYLAREPAILRTLLGSCVGATFWSPRLRVGALCHAQLPKCPGNLDKLTLAAGRRY